jgi:hypothetical protein
LAVGLVAVLGFALLILRASLTRRVVPVAGLLRDRGLAGTILLLFLSVGLFAAAAQIMPPLLAGMRVRLGLDPLMLQISLTVTGIVAALLAGLPPGGRPPSRGLIAAALAACGALWLLLVATGAASLLVALAQLVQVVALPFLLVTLSTRAFPRSTEKIGQTAGISALVYLARGLGSLCGARAMLALYAAQAGQPVPAAGLRHLLPLAGLGGMALVLSAIVLFLPAVPKGMLADGH